jgi:hypothetical protein
MNYKHKNEVEPSLNIEHNIASTDMKLSGIFLCRNNSYTLQYHSNADPVALTSAKGLRAPFIPFTCESKSHPRKGDVPRKEQTQFITFRL